MDDVSGREAVAVAGESVDARVLQAAERERVLFDCRGTVWATHVNGNGAPTCHGDVYPQGAPDLATCKAQIEVHTPAKGYVVAGGGPVWDPYEISEEQLLRFGGGRRYRVSLRKGGNHVKKSALYFDLQHLAEPRALPGEDGEERETSPAPRAAPAVAPTGDSAEALLRLGGDPVAALLGAAITTMPDPMMKLAFALAMDRAATSERYRAEEAARAERQLQFFTGLQAQMSRAQSDSGGGAVVALMREQATQTAARLAAVEQENARHREELSRAQVEAARVANANAPPPVNPLAQEILSRAAEVAVRETIKAVGPDTMRAVVGAVAGGAGPVPA